MKIKEGFTLKKHSGQNIIVSENDSFRNTITLSETASYLWQQLCERNMTKEQLLNALLNHYDISTVLALNDIDVFVKTLNENGILEK